MKAPRRRALTLVLLFLVVHCTTRSASADGLIERLPDDGAWAEYDFKLTTNIDGQSRELRSRLRLSSVGKLKQESVDHRWIELKVSQTRPEMSDEVIKLLVPEKHLTAGENPLGKLVRGWQKRGDGEIRALNLDRPELRVGPLALFLIPPLRDVQQLDKQELAVEGLGKLSATRAGKATLPLSPGLDVPVEVTIWRSDQVAFGTVKVQMEFKLTDGKRKAQGSLEITLVKTGKDATTTLSDAK